MVKIPQVVSIKMGAATWPLAERYDALEVRRRAGSIDHVP